MGPERTGSIAPSLPRGLLCVKIYMTVSFTSVLLNSGCSRSLALPEVSSLVGQYFLHVFFSTYRAISPALCSQPLTYSQVLSGCFPLLWSHMRDNSTAETIVNDEHLGTLSRPVSSFTLRRNLCRGCSRHHRMDGRALSKDRCVTATPLQPLRSPVRLQYKQQSVNVLRNARWLMRHAVNALNTLLRTLGPAENSAFD
jgi:hypothetical protein